MRVLASERREDSREDDRVGLMKRGEQHGHVSEDDERPERRLQDHDGDDESRERARAPPSQPCKRETRDQEEQRE